MSIRFNDFSDELKEKIQTECVNWLEEASGEVESRTKRNTKVGHPNGGKTKNSWEHKVDEGELTAEVGSRYKNALWEELGTGEYALNGDGRKGGWVYKNPNATFNKDGSLRKNSKYSAFVFTLGKKPHRALHRAYESNKNKIIRNCKRRFKEL